MCSGDGWSLSGFYLSPSYNKTLFALYWLKVTKKEIKTKMGIYVC